MPQFVRRCLCACLVSTFVAGCQSKPANPEELLRARSLGLGYLERNRLPEAEQQFKLIVAGAPKDPFGYANLGLTYIQAGRLAEAETQLRRARDLDPSSVDVGRMLAKVYALTNRRADARTILEQLERAQPRDAKVLYALAKLDSADDQSGQKAEARLRQVLAVAPANLAVRLQLLNVFVRRGEADSALRQIEEIRRLPPEPPQEATPLITTAIDLLRAGKVADAKPVVDRFTRIMQVTTPYQASLADVKWIDDPIVGRPVLTFQPQSVIQLRSSGVLITDDTLRFVDATSDAGLPYAGVTTPNATDVNAPPPASASMLATGDFNGDGAEEALASFWSVAERKLVTRLFLVERWRSLDVTAKTALTLPAGATGAAVGDFDNDGWLDLFVIGSDARGYLLRNAAGAKFEDVTAKSGTTDVRGARKALFVDVDHDGDLDLLLVGGARNLVYRNNLDGTFTEVAESMGLAGRSPTHDIAFADFDDDGHIDLVTATDAGVTLYRNTGARRFEDVTPASGLPSTGGFGSVLVGDYDNNGTFDLFLTHPGSGAPELWRNDGTGKFTRDARSATLGGLATAADLRAEFVDVDNDGWLDLIAVGTPKAGQRGAYLLRNDGTGKFIDRSSVLPALRGGASVVPADVDNDGDMDVLIGDERGIRLLANEGSNSRLAVQVALLGLRTGSGKNNDFGIGARLDLRTGDTHQTRVVTSRVTHFGLGSRLKADVLRVQWPNGVPQTVYFPGTDQDVLELELLKGSCAFLYTWDGRGFRFVTDVMWRSALGMPVGLMASDEDGGTMYAPAGASREYLRIPGVALKPRDGRYVLQLTEELWETAYTDHMKLLTVDHPDSVDVFVDERFVPPGPVKLRFFHAVRQRPPRSAIDDRGNDVLAALRQHDDVYVSNLTPIRYQGLVEPHDLTLDLGEDAGQPGTVLVLRGWIYPTDASINVAVSQQSAIKPMSPALEVVGANGQWTTAIPVMGFPSGKDKTIVIDLAGKFPTKDHRVRIRTNMQIYWDQALVASNARSAPVKVDTLAPLSADLHYRGFSRTYRKGGRYGPHWFDYDQVAKESPWRVIEGAFTRFGDVRALLENPDDMYVIMAPGDEATIQFDAASASTVPKGWTRDFLLYTDGWIKDADLNTAFGNTVAPLPFHGMKAYPYAPGEAYPTDAQHQRFLREYNTRLLDRRRSGSQ
jgi:Tfp pilus assembly protein PilF